MGVVCSYRLYACQTSVTWGLAVHITGQETVLHAILKLVQLPWWNIFWLFEKFYCYFIFVNSKFLVYTGFV